MNLAEITEAIREKIGEDCGVPHTLKIDMGDGEIVYIDGTASPNEVSNDDKEAELTITLSREDMEETLNGNLNLQMAYMSGKLSLVGDMSVAMAFSSAF